MKMKRYESVDAYIESLENWRDEVIRLREIILSTELVEAVKWGAPCYLANGKNVVGLGAFRDYFGIWFYQGVFLADPENVLINAQEGKTRGLRQWRFQSKKDIRVRLIRAYLKEAIELAKQGREIRPQKAPALDVPAELQAALAKNKKAATAFARLTPGRQREYSEYVAEAKRADTKTRRIDKILPLIQSGVGLNDRYRQSASG